MVDELRAHAVAALDLVDVRDVVAGEHVRVRRAALHLVVEPAVRQLGEQRIAVGGELGRVDLALGFCLLLQLGRAVVRVDEAVDMPAEAQCEQEIALGGRHASNNAACP